MILYSYIFNSIRKGYTKAGDSTPGVYAISIVTLLQLMTVYELYILPDRLNGKHWKVTNEDKVLVVSVLLFVMLLNYLYFYKIKSPEIIDTQIKNLSANKIKTLQILTFIHSLLAIGLFVLLANLS